MVESKEMYDIMKLEVKMGIFANAMRELIEEFRNCMDFLSGEYAKKFGVEKCTIAKEDDVV